MDLAVLPADVRARITAPQSVQLAPDGTLYCPDCYTMGMTRVTRNMLTALEHAQCPHDPIEYYEDYDYVLGLLAAITTESDTITIAGLPVNRRTFESFARQLDDVPDYEPELAPLVPEATRALTRKLAEHEDWVRTQGSEALRRYASSVDMLGLPRSWSSVLRQVVVDFVEGQEPSDSAVRLPDGEVLTVASVLDRLRRHHARTTSTDVLVMQVEAFHDTFPTPPSPRTRDALTSMMPTQHTLVAPAVLEPVVHLLLGDAWMDARVSKTVVPVLSAEALDNLTTLLRDGMDAEEALVVAQLL